jgi:uncharacterized YigZ family protein
MSTDRYRSLAGEGQGQLREKASRFIAIAFPLRTEEQFKERMQAFMKEHHGARHFCHAWIMGDGGERHRANDAGEPAGTAGKPILNRMRGREITWCGVIVVRYFGGTLLGKAGLVKAYGEAAQLALEDAPISEHIIHERVRIRCDYAQLEGIRNAVIACGGAVEESLFTERCELLVSLPRTQVKEQLESWSLQGIKAVPQEGK